MSFSLPRVFSVLALMFATTLGSGCVNELDRLTDCQDICSRYSSCFDKAYDVESCRSRCTENARNDEKFDQKVDTCENCLDDRSCASATFGCATECATIVP